MAPDPGSIMLRTISCNIMESASSEIPVLGECFHPDAASPVTGAVTLTEADARVGIVALILFWRQDTKSLSQGQF